MRSGGGRLVKGASYWLLAWSVPISIGVGYGLGWLLDELFGGEPWLQIIGFLLGAAAGLTQIFQSASSDDE